MKKWTIPLILATTLILPTTLAAVDRQLRTFEDQSYTYQNRYFRTGSTIYFRALGTASATSPRLTIQVGGVSIDVDLIETPPNSGIYKTVFYTDPLQTNDDEDTIRTFNGASVILSSDIDRDGIQGTTDVFNITMDDQAPTRPRYCDSNATEEGSVRVNWTEYKGKDFRRYTVVRSFNQSFSDAVDVANITDQKTVQWFDPEHNLLSGLTYWYGIRVYDWAGNPSILRPSELPVIPFNDTTSPQVVVGVETDVPEEGNSIILSWNRSLEQDVVGYLIYHSIDRTPMWIDPMSPSERRYNPLPDVEIPEPEDLIAFTTGTSWTHQGISSNYDHYYAVVAIDEEENPSQKSGTVGNTSDDTLAPGPPSNLAITSDETGYLNVSWTAPTGEEVFVYNIYRAETSGGQQFWNVYTTTQETYYLDKNVEHGKTYFYVIRSRDVAGNEEKNVQQASMNSIDATPPGPPRGLKADETETSKGGRIKLVWLPPGGESPEKYFVYRSNVSQGHNFTSPLAQVSRTDFLDRTVQDGVMYYYIVRSVDGAGNVETNSDEIGVTSEDLTPPPPVEDVGASARRGGSIGISWLPPGTNEGDIERAAEIRADIHHYHVYWNTYEGFEPDPEKMLPPNTETMAIHTDLVDGQRYYYIVRSVDAAGNENLNDPGASAIADTSPPSSPTNLRTFRLDDGRIRLDWDAPSGEAPYRYNIYRARSPGAQIFGVLPFSMVFHGSGETEFVDENVTHGQSYYYVVRSADFLLNEDQNTNEVGNISEDRLPPGAPTELVVKKLAGGDLMINWTEPAVESSSPIYGPREADRAVLFRVYSSTEPGDHDFSKYITETPLLYYIDRGLRDRQDYYYVVRALDAAGNEDQNVVQIKGTADASPPSPPMNEVVQRTPRGEILLSWDDPEGEEVFEYRIYRFIGNETQDFSQPYVVTRKNTFVDNDVTEAVQYRYVIRSVDKAGNEGRNTIEILAPVLLGPPLNVIARAEKNGNIRLTWEPPAEGAGTVKMYNIYRNTRPGIEELGQPWDETVLTSFTDQDRVLPGGTTQFMVHGTRYYYTIRAIDIYNNEGTKSEEVSAVADRIPPQPPDNLNMVELPSGDIELRWTTPAGERVAKYNIYKSTQSGLYNFIVPYAETGRIIYLDEDTSSGVTYFYVVRSVDEAGNEEQNTEEISGKAFDAPPGAPRNLRLQVRPEGSISLIWSPPSGEVPSYYNIYRSTQSMEYDFDQPYKVSGMAGDLDIFVENGQTYYYIVRSVDSTGNEEENLNERSATSLDSKPPGQPIGLEASPHGTGSILLQWEHPRDEIPANYRIYRSLSPFFKPGNQFVLNSTAGLSYLDTGLGDSQTYYYVVRSVDSIGNEDENENRVSATTPPGFPPNLEATTNNRGEIVLRWDTPATPVQVFRIYRSGSSMEYNFAQPIDEIPYPTGLYIDTGLNHSQQYFYIVRSVDSKGGEETNENEVSAISMERIPPLSPESLEAMQLTNGGVQIRWEHQDLGDVEYFNVYRNEGGPGSTPGMPIATTNLTGYEDLDTVSGETYSYLVRAVDDHDNEDTNDIWKTVIAVDLLPPEQPGNLTAKAITGGSIELSWEGVSESNVTYAVYRTISPDMSNITRVTSTNQTTYLDENLVNGREYFYLVRSMDYAGNEEDNEIVVSAVASKSGPRILLALAMVSVFILGGFVVERRRKAAEAES